MRNCTVSEPCAKSQFRCSVCNLLIRKNGKITVCGSCFSKNHVRCEGLDSNQFEFIKKYDQEYLCRICKEGCIPFQKLAHESFLAHLKDLKKVSDGSLQILPNHKMKSLYNCLNADYVGDSEDSVSTNCKYYLADEIPKKVLRGKMSLFHLNIASLNAHKDELEDMLSVTGFKPKILALTETGIKKDIVPDFDTEMAGYKFFDTPTESLKGGTALYIETSLDSTQRKDLEKICYLSQKLESTFVEINLKGKKTLLQEVFTNTQILSIYHS